MLDRWSKAKRKDIVFTEYDLDIIRLVASRFDVREPWSYRFLTTPYFKALLGRGNYLENRLPKLTWHEGYLELTEGQSKRFTGFQVRNIGKLGNYQFDADYSDTLPHSRTLPHSLFANLIAASFEIGAKKNNLTIQPRSRQATEQIIPDWPIFSLLTPDHERYIWIEADTGTEPMRRLTTQGTSITDKLIHYRDALASREITHSMILFVTTTPGRAREILKTIRMVFDKHESLAKHIAVKHVQFTPDLFKLPPATPWAVEENWQRAHADLPFHFLKPEPWRT